MWGLGLSGAWYKVAPGSAAAPEPVMCPLLQATWGGGADNYLEINQERQQEIKASTKNQELRLFEITKG